MAVKKRLFIGLISGSTLLLLALGGATIYLFSHQDSFINRISLWGIGTVFTALLLVVASGIGGMVLTLWSARSISPLQGAIRITINLLFPLALALGRILKIDRDAIRGSFVEVNNQMVRTRKVAVPPAKVLVLAPHCLQRAECPHKVTNNVQNCKECGLCPIGGLLELSRRYGVKLAVATGGTLARRFVEEYRPRAIVAVACERDLTSGIQDTNPLPVLGVLNRRPHGPCFNTEVDLLKVEEAIRYFIG